MQVVGAAQLRLIYALGPLEGAVNVLGLVVSGNPTIDQALANLIGADVKGAFTTHLAPVVGTTVNLARVGIRDLRTDNQPEFRDTAPAVPGTATGDLLPKGAALVVTQRTAKSGKSFRGRVYLPGFTETNNDATGSTIAAASTAAINFISAIYSALGPRGFSGGVISRPAEAYVITKTTTHSNGTTTTETLSRVTAKSGQVTPVTAWETRNARWEYQRRRDNGRTISPTLLSGPLFSASMPV